MLIMHTLKPVSAVYFWHVPFEFRLITRMHVLTVQAISAALSQQWEQAVTLNQKILQENPQDYDALNRLAYAFLELGRFDEAQEIFQRVLVLDPKNFIATKNLDKLHKLRNSFALNNHDEYQANDKSQIYPDLFLEEPGKTKTTHLIRIAAKDVVAGLRVGYQVNLSLKNRTIAVSYGRETCIGYLPDDLAFRLCRFIQAGNQYVAYVKSVSPTLITIFIKETKKSEAFDDVPSFMDTKKIGKPQVRHIELKSAGDKTAHDNDYEPEASDEQFEQDN